MRQSFTIPGRLDGLNEFIEAYCKGRYVGAKCKKENEEIVGYCILAARLKPMATPVDVKITWHEQPNRGQMRDKDNLVFQLKFIFDALVRAGIIKDDGFNHIGDIDPKLVRVDKDPRIVVELENHE